MSPARQRGVHRTGRHIFREVEAALFCEAAGPRHAAGDHPFHLHEGAAQQAKGFYA